jgi:Tfp pilus assembly PilM family ATPase
MIRELFLPRHIGSRYIIPQRVVGIDVARTYVSASQIYVKDTSITIEKCINDALEIGNNTTYEERVINALKNLKPQLNHYDLLRSTIPSSIAVVKELTLPFTEIEKIKMVLEYEIEPLLPFSAHDAIVDGIITKIIPEEQKSLVLVAAVPKEYIANHLQLLQAANLDPDIISIDFFDLYALYRKIASQKEAQGAQVLIDIESHTTRIGYIYNGALRIVRTLPKGIITQVKLMSDSLGMQPSAVMEQLMRHGFNHDDRSFTQSLREALDTFWQDIAFTLNSFTVQADHKIDTILLFGAGSEIHGLTSFITEKTGTRCDKIDINQVTHQKNIVTKQNGIIAQNCIMSLASALNFNDPSSFNLRKKEFTSSKASLLMKQLVMAGMLSCILIFGLIGYTVYELSSLHLEISRSTEELSKEITDRFKITEEEGAELDDLISKAKSDVEQREKVMFAFSGGHKKSFLEYLAELTKILHKDALELTLNRLQIAENTLTLEGSVPGDDQLRALVDALETAQCFKYTGRQQDLQKQNFQAINIKIPLNKAGGR